ncbi:sulfatase [Halovenus rubra]|uniref:Sulfatase n=2 Tax=Halovenus rubra TaxID=869890 RepID=A0ACC7DXI2_9EURY
MNERNNVLLVILDSVRAKNTSLYGYERETTPFLSEFADRATVYTQARAPSIHSIASHVSMFTGAHVEEHEATRHTAQIDLDRTIWRELQNEGYATGLFTNNRIVANASNLGDGFQYRHEPEYPIAERLENAVDGTVLKRAYFRGYDAFSRLTESVSENGLVSRVSDSIGRVADIGPSSETDADSGYRTLFGDEFTDSFLDWQSQQDDAWAACINLMDTHSPYEPEATYDKWADERHWDIQENEKPSVWETLRGSGWDNIEALEDLYDGTIRQADAILKDLVTKLEAKGELSDTLLVVTSDHGEAFGEQSRLKENVRLRGHKWGIPEVLTHVPLVVSYPGQEVGRTVDKVVSLTDTPDLLRAGATGDGEDPLTGRKEVLASTYRIPEKKIKKYSSVENVNDYIGPWRAVYENGEDGIRKFAQKDDSFLTADVAGADDATVVSTAPHKRVQEAYEPLVDSEILAEETSEIDDNLEEQLEDLGYIR